MSTYSYVSFPASGVKAGMDNVLHTVANYVVGKFPHRVIRGVYVDTRDKMRNIYMNLYTNFAGDKNKTLPHNVQEIRKQERPHLYVGYTLDGFDTSETGLGEFPLLFYPNAHWFDERMTSVLPVLRDEKRHILVGTYNLRIRVVSEFLFSCQNKEEQITIYIYLKNFIKEKYAHIINGVKTKYVFPEAVLMSLKNILYGKETPYKDIENDFNEYLSKTSKGTVLPVWRDGREDSKFYEMSYVYRAVRFNLTGPMQFDDGDKKDMAYDNYTIRFPAITEFYVPINYVLKSPELIPSALGKPNLIDDELLIDSAPDENNNVQLLKIIKKYKDEAERGFIDYDNYTLIKRDEFALEKANDFYDIKSAFSPKDREILTSLSEKEKRTCLKVCVFEDDTLLDEGKYCSVDYKELKVYINHGEVDKLQMIEIYADLELIDSYWKNTIKQNKNINKRKRLYERNK
jgi:hypothetical protein